MNKIRLQSPDGEHNVIIDQGELVSYTYNSEEIMHQKGNPGWRNVDTEMFPLIGATAPNDFKVETPRGTCIQDQHGLLRELNYEMISQVDHRLSFHKKYLKNTAVKNAKFPEKSTEKWVSWLYDFEFSKNFNLTNEGLQVEFEIKAEKGMPFMLGYHPAFMLEGNKKERVKSSSNEVSIEDVMEVGDAAYPLQNISEVTLVKENSSNVTISISGFDNFMLWTPVANMLCIEPITFYPNATKDCLSKEMFRITKGKEFFKVTIRPS